MRDLLVGVLGAQKRQLDGGQLDLTVGNMGEDTVLRSGVESATTSASGQ